MNNETTQNTPTLTSGWVEHTPCDLCEWHCTHVHEVEGVTMCDDCFKREVYGE